MALLPSGDVTTVPAEPPVTFVPAITVRLSMLHHSERNVPLNAVRSSVTEAPGRMRSDACCSRGHTLSLTSFHAGQQSSVHPVGIRAGVAHGEPQRVGAGIGEGVLVVKDRVTAVQECSSRSA